MVLPELKIFKPADTVFFKLFFLLQDLLNRGAYFFGVGRLEADDYFPYSFAFIEL